MSNRKTNTEAWQRLDEIFGGKGTSSAGSIKLDKDTMRALAHVVSTAVGNPKLGSLNQWIGPLLDTLTAAAERGSAANVKPAPTIGWEPSDTMKQADKAVNAPVGKTVDRPKHADPNMPMAAEPRRPTAKFTGDLDKDLPSPDVDPPKNPWMELGNLGKKGKEHWADSLPPLPSFDDKPAFPNASSDKAKRGIGPTDFDPATILDPDKKSKKKASKKSDDDDLDAMLRNISKGGGEALGLPQVQRLNRSRGAEKAAKAAEKKPKKDDGEANVTNFAKSEIDRKIDGMKAKINDYRETLRNDPQHRNRVKIQHAIEKLEDGIEFLKAKDAEKWREDS